MSQIPNEKISRQVEKIAVGIFSSWVGATGEVIDTGDGNGPDFEIVYRDGRTGIGEVGLHEDPVQAAAWSAVNKRETPHVIALPEGFGVWGVSLIPGSNINKLEQEIESLLRTLINERRNSLAVHHGNPRDDVTNLAKSLGITRLNRHFESTGDRAVYLFMGAAGVVPTDSNRLTSWIEEVLLSDEYQDSWKKLFPFTRDQKHVFIMTSGRTEWGIEELLKRTKDNLPTLAPSLPGDLTHIWIMGRYGDGSVTYWSNESGWTTMEG